MWEQSGNLERKLNFYKTEELRIYTVLFKWFTRAHRLKTFQCLDLL
jgi:hypothetical protein